MGIARSTYYGAPAADRDAEIVARIEAICAEFEAYGYPRLTAELRHQGQLVNSKRVRRLMREHSLSPKQRRRYVATTDSDHDGRGAFRTRRSLADEARSGKDHSGPSAKVV